MTEDHLLRRQLRSYIRDCLYLSTGLLSETTSWPADLARVPQFPSLGGFRWHTFRCGMQLRYLGIRRLNEKPTFSFTRLAADGFHVTALHRLTYLCDDLSLSRYLIAEIVTPAKIVIHDCADQDPKQWYVLDEYTLRRLEHPAAPHDCASLAQGSTLRPRLYAEPID